MTVTLPVTGAVPPHGEQRRERKKRQTRDALVRAALALFNAKGYEHTAVREITDAVDVSERTFFRYFDNKEHVVLSFLKDATDSFVREVAARPADETPLTALVRSFPASIPAPDEHPDEEWSYLLVIRLIDATPSLLSGLMRDMHDREDEIIRVLAAREGVDPATDRRPRLAVSTYSGIVVAANREWRTGGDDSVEALVAAFDAWARQLGPALSGHWR